MRGKLNYLDGLRGIAALVVVFHHFAAAFLPAAIFGNFAVQHLGIETLLYFTPLSLLIDGNFAVCIFFVLSGFVLSHKFFLGKTDAVVSGAIRRYARLMPLVFSSVIIAFIALRAGLFHNLEASTITGSSNWLAASWNSPGSLLQALKLGLYDAFFTGHNVLLYNNVLWTMKIEFLGSMMVFAFLALFGQLRHRWIIYAIVAILLIKSYYLAFLIGIILSDLSVRRQLTSVRHEWKVAALVGAFIGGSLVIPSASNTLIGRVASTVMSPDTAFLLGHIFAAGLLVAAILALPKLQTALQLKPFAYLGRISFSLYVIHLTVIGTLGCYVFLRINNAGGYALATAAALLATLAVSIPAAHLLTRYIDEPAVALSGKLYRTLFTSETINLAVIKKPLGLGATALRKVASAIMTP